MMKFKDFIPFNNQGRNTRATVNCSFTWNPGFTFSTLELPGYLES